MNTMNRSPQSADMLQETASRLIDAVGLECAIFVCRSNYWHGVLRIIEERQNNLQVAAADSRPAVAPIRLHSLPQSNVGHDSWADLPVAA